MFNCVEGYGLRALDVVIENEKAEAAMHRNAMILVNDNIIVKRREEGKEEEGRGRSDVTYTFTDLNVPYVLT
jgi:hypothetical protein